MIVRVNVVLNRSVVDSDCRFDNLCVSHLQIFRVKVSCITSVDGIPLTLASRLVNYVSHDVIGRMTNNRGIVKRIASTFSSRAE